MRIKKAIRALLTMLGALFLGIVLHEIYHILTLSYIQSVCLDFGGKMTMYVNGIGNSSEIVGHMITIIIMVLGIIFAIYDFRK